MMADESSADPLPISRVVCAGWGERLMTLAGYAYCLGMLMCDHVAPEPPYTADLPDRLGTSNHTVPTSVGPRLMGDVM